MAESSPASSGTTKNAPQATTSNPTPKKVLTNGALSSSSAKNSHLTPALRSDINASLLAGGQVEKIQSHLLTLLSQSSWPSSIRQLCLSLLRSGEVTSYAQLVQRVREEVRKGEAGSWDVGVPRTVVSEGVGVVRECLAEVIEIEG
ncbi:MAG: hypothetical protein M1837_001649 [Sclerophora amabilis]|nr:MAG: hypothetical protein M1837_001649 [Sclerophora amabilis]